MNLQIRTRDNVVYSIFSDGTPVSANGILEVDFKRNGSSLDLDVIEKSYTPGAQFIGERRVRSSLLQLSLYFAEDTDAFRDNFNNAMYYASAAEYIEDTDNGIRVKVEFQEYADSPTNSRGTINRAGYADIIFKQLTPFWEDITEQEDTRTGQNITAALTNSGYADTPPTFEIESASACDLIKLYITTPTRGIEIQDLAFGISSTLDTYAIDNNAGTALLGDDELNRNSRIQSGSGFFAFPVGSFTLNMDFSTSVDVTTKWRRRYFI